MRLKGRTLLYFYADTENTTARSANLANGQSLDLPIHDDQIYYFAIESSKSMYCVAIGPSFFRNASLRAKPTENCGIYRVSGLKAFTPDLFTVNLTEIQVNNNDGTLACYNQTDCENMTCFDFSGKKRKLLWSIYVPIQGDSDANKQCPSPTLTYPTSTPTLATTRLSMTPPPTSTGHGSSVCVSNIQSLLLLVVAVGCGSFT
ncbi:hypothetical protein GBAR_LOCUS23134 [Geodia barretti]|uniref:Uncharacterized protein n=1 Tax=Geodia barretti TaxID=519541 RepID=A0AA35T6G0_GEOBA|nr:hypothetical protein GBAR_LOCUS23134 [Geodia barretti]